MLRKDEMRPNTSSSTAAELIEVLKDPAVTETIMSALGLHRTVDKYGNN